MINSLYAWQQDDILNINANLDFSLGNYFLLKPTGNEIWNVTRLIFSLTDSGTLDSGGYGNGVALTNGISIQKYNKNGLVFDLNSQFKIKQNGQWQALCHDLNKSSFGIGNEWLSSRYTFSKDTNSKIGILLDGANGDEIRITLDDDFTGLVGHYFRFGINNIS